MYNSITVRIKKIDGKDYGNDFLTVAIFEDEQADPGTEFIHFELGSDMYSMKVDDIKSTTAAFWLDGFIMVANEGKGASYEISKSEFEKVLNEFNIDGLQ